jgi:predicted DNA-binding transcriptional regulator YafY
MNRIDRVTAILIHLQSKKIVKAQDIAERFSISLRTVYRDIKTLEEAGVPIIGEAGLGYSIMEGYRLPPVMFTPEEATAFITADKLVEKFTDTHTSINYQNALYKVKAVLRSTEKTLLENMEDHIEVLRRFNPLQQSAVKNVLPVLLKSIAEKKALHISYTALHNNNGSTERIIEPIGIFYSSGNWHTIAFCRLRSDYRHFRTDRINHIHTTGEPFSKEHPTLRNYLEQYPEQADMQTVVIRLPQQIAKYLQEQKYYYGFISEQVLNNEEVEMSFLVNHLEYFVRWFLGFADKATLLRPAAAQDRLQALVQEIGSRIGAQPVAAG